MKQSILVLLLFLGLSYAGISNNSKPENDGGLIEIVSGSDTLKYRTYQGKVIDKRNSTPIVFANLFVVGTNLGTVTNSEGEFIIKITENLLNNYIGIAHIGYNRTTIPIMNLSTAGNIIEMQNSPIPIKEVIISGMDPLKLIQQALNKIPQNYPTEPVMVTSFYRETIKKNRNYVSISEAVLDVYKSSYTNMIEQDRIRIFKGRRGQDVNRMDTVMLKYQGGHYTAFLLDLIKNPGDVLSENVLSDYEYKISGIVSMDGNDNWIIEFDQRDDVTFPLYKGKIYIDTESKAITGLEFGISPKRIARASTYMIRKKPMSMNIDVLSGYYLTNYRFVQGKWYLNYVRSEIVLNCKWEKKLFRTNYTVVSEMAVTDTDLENIEKFRIRESAKTTDILVEQVTDFEDPDFWGDYNVIKPDESIQSAIEKLGKRLKRKASS